MINWKDISEYDNKSEALFDSGDYFIVAVPVKGVLLEVYTGHKIDTTFKRFVYVEELRDES